MQHEIDNLRQENLRLNRELAQKNIELRLKEEEFEALETVCEARVQHFKDQAAHDAKHAKLFHDQTIALKAEIFQRDAETQALCKSYQRVKLVFKTQIDNYNHAVASQSNLDHLETVLAATESTIERLFTRVTSMERNQSALVGVIGQYEQLAVDALSEASETADDYQDACDKLVEFALQTPDADRAKQTPDASDADRLKELQGRHELLEQYYKTVLDAVRLQQHNQNEMDKYIYQQNCYIQSLQYNVKAFHSMVMGFANALAAELHGCCAELAPIANGFHARHGDAQEIARLKSEVARLEDECRQAIASAQDLERHNAELEEQCRRATASAQDLKRHNAELKKSRFAPDEAREMRNTIAQAAARVDECNQRIRQQDELIDEADFTLGRLRKEHAEKLEKLEAAFARLKLHAADVSAYIDPEDVENIRREMDDWRDKIHDFSVAMQDQHDSLHGTMKCMRKNFEFRLEHIMTRFGEIKAEAFQTQIRMTQISNECNAEKQRFALFHVDLQNREMELLQKYKKTQEMLRHTQAELNRYKEQAGKEPFTKHDFLKERADILLQNDRLKINLAQCRAAVDSQTQMNHQLNQMYQAALEDVSILKLHKMTLEDSVATMKKELEMLRGMQDSDSESEAA